jgi:hypothetical protein
LSILYGLGQCYFSFRMLWPSTDTVLGAGVSEADRQLMSGRAIDPRPFASPNGVAVDFGATATRGAGPSARWLFRQPMTYQSACAPVPTPLRRLSSWEATTT